jgi:radical SAM superfamily enzyme YgiQ (UPF0313 family)
MKILLVNPPNCGRSIPEERYGIENLKLIFRGEPLALEVVAGNLDGHDVRILDLKVEPDFLRETVGDFQPDLVGITGMTCEANTMLELASEIKCLSDAVIVVGGHHASCEPIFFNRPQIDFVVVGIGKLSFRELVDALENNIPVPAIDGIIKTNPAKTPVFKSRKYSKTDLVDHKPPRYDLVENNRDHYVMSGAGGKMGFVASAFGCTHRCLFCSIPNMTGGKYLCHRVDAIIRDMGLIGGMPVIRLVDANTFGDIETARKLGWAIIDAETDRKIVADVRADTVVRHPKLFELWKEAGLITAVIGFEEISDRRLADFNKKTDVETNIAALQLLKEIGIKVIGDFIVSPDYTDEDFEALEIFIEKNPIDLPLPAILTPIPGTKLFELKKREIKIHNLDYYTFTNAVTPTVMAEHEFYKNYSRLLEKFIRHVGN